MFELSVALKYLFPRRRQLSTSIISLISILVIALVVWLIVVFFSVTDGLEKTWIQKLTALTAPIRITPTDAYFNSFYYQIDGISEASGYSYKTIREKKESTQVNPYDPDLDEEVPAFWAPPDLDREGNLKDLVNLAYNAVNEVKNTNLQAQDFELTGSHIYLKLTRPSTRLAFQKTYPGSSQSYLSYPAFLGNLDENNNNLNRTLLPIQTTDINNIFSLMAKTDDPSKEESTEAIRPFAAEVFRERFENFFKRVEITSFKTPISGWRIPQNLIPENIVWDVVVVFKKNALLKIIVPLNKKNLKSIEDSFKDEPELKTVQGVLKRGEQKGFDLEIVNQHSPLPSHISVLLQGGEEFPAIFDKTSLDHAKKLEDLKFNIHLTIQQIALSGTINAKNLEIGQFKFINETNDSTSASPFWLTPSKGPENPSLKLPIDPQIGNGVLLPKGFREAGALIGDRGYLTYGAVTASTLQEQRIPIFVAGFYDPGIIPIGGKFILVDRNIVSIVRSSHNQDDRSQTNGINVRFNDYRKADEIKKELSQLFTSKGISRYWKIETYHEFEFTKEILKELRSQKNIFTLIALVIIVVACSNIISMLIILVNDKKVEIGILRSMGASSKSIALIFGTAGMFVGVFGSILGIGAAILTLSNINALIFVLSYIQGHDVLNSALYGEIIPHELSMEALFFVMIATIVISLLAGIVPAVKACLLKPSSILRSTG